MLLCWIYQKIGKLFLFPMHQNSLNRMGINCSLGKWEEFTVSESEARGVCEGGRTLATYLVLKTLYE